MGPVWKIVAPVGVIVLLATVLTLGVLSAGADEPPARAPIELSPVPSDTAATPSSPPSNSPSRPATAPTGSASVVSPRPQVDDDDDDEHDDDDDDDDEHDDERDGD